MVVKLEFQWHAIPVLQIQEEIAAIVEVTVVVVEDVTDQGHALVRVAVSVVMDVTIRTAKAEAAQALLLPSDAALMAKNRHRVVEASLEANQASVRLMMAAATVAHEAVQTRVDQTQKMFIVDAIARCVS